AGAMGRKAEVFVLDMGDPVRIYDLALRMIHLAGLEERTEESTQGDIAIEFVGLRPGEKLYEELLVQGNEQTTRHPRIRQADEPSLSLVEFSNLLERVQYALGRGDQDDVRDALLRFPVQYQACESHRAASESALAGQSV
ncbi:MAG: polysaccharide biosynthesis protein, partial [Oceanococcaceae bacterium]